MYRGGRNKDNSFREGPQIYIESKHVVVAIVVHFLSQSNLVAQAIPHVFTSQVLG